MRFIHSTIFIVAMMLLGELPCARSATNIFSNAASAPVIRAWGTTAGLPQNTVKAMIQSRDGYLWLGTSDGLVRFDGMRFTTYGLDDGLPSVDICALLEDHDGVIWIATAAGGFGRWREGHVESIDPALERHRVTCFQEDMEGRLWVGTRRGLRCFRDGKRESVLGLELLKDAIVRSLSFDASGTLWIGVTDQGLVAYKNSQAKICPGPPGNEMVVPHCLLSDHRGRLWVSVGNGRVLCREQEQWHVYDAADGLPFPFITSLAEDSSGTIWAGSLDVGLYRFDGARFHPIRKADGLSADDISSLCADHEGNLWVGTRTGGLNQLRRRSLLCIGSAQGLTNDFVHAVAETPDGTLWAGTIGGSLYRGGLHGFEAFRSDPIVPFYAHIYAVLAASDGSLWWGGGGCLLHWQEGRITKIYANESWVHAKGVTALHEDGAGGLWIGNSAGELVHLCNGTVSPFPQPVARGTITALASEPDGALWVGSAGGGVKRVRIDFSEVLTVSHELASSSIRTLYRDADGTLWIGTAGGGLSCWRKGKVTNFTAAQGLATRTVSQIVEDHHGCLWLGSNRGVFKVHKQDLIDCAKGRLSFVHARSFGTADGMLAEECSGGFCPAGLLTRSGLVCISTVRGLALLDPDEPPEQTPPPDVMLEEIVVNGRPWPPMGRGAGAAPLRLTIPPGERNVEFHYTAIHFSAPEKLGFRYQLKGADTGAIEAGGRRTAYYQRLAPGEYTFVAQACNPDGMWGKPLTAVTLTVLPFFWETAWFRAAVLLAAIGSLWWLLRRRYHARLARLQMQNAIERERLRISKDMHDHIGGMLTQVSQLTDMTLTETGKPEVVASRLDRIGKRARDAVRALDEIVWATNPKNDNLASFAEYISRFGDEFFEDSGIRCWQEVPASIPCLPLRAEVRHNVFLAVREACNNALKHARATEVWLRLNIDRDQVWLEVQDNGCGFNTDQVTVGGNGLGNMRARLAEDGGQTVITSQPGKGTTIRFIFPVQSRV